MQQSFMGLVCNSFGKQSKFVQISTRRIIRRGLLKCNWGIKGQGHECLSYIQILLFSGVFFLVDVGYLSTLHSTFSSS